MTHGRVLIVLLTYKSRLDWLREALHSVVSQSYRHWKCVVADSTPLPSDYARGTTPEDIRNMVASFSDDRLEMRGFPHQATGDVAYKVNESARIYGKDCDYIVVMSDDDYLSPFFLEKQIATLEEDPRRGFGQGCVHTFGDTLGLWLPGDGRTDIAVQDQVGQNQYAGTCVMRMAPFLEFGGYDKDVVPEGFPCGLEDFNLFVHFLRNGYTTKVIPEVLLFARQRPEQNNRRLYGTPLYSKMVHKVCEKNGIKVVMHDPEKPGDPMRYTLEYEQHTREACTSSQPNS